jgi:hypothetical protein
LCNADVGVNAQMNRLQQQVVHHQNVFAQVEVQQAEVD